MEQRLDVHMLGKVLSFLPQSKLFEQLVNTVSHTLHRICTDPCTFPIHYRRNRIQHALTELCSASTPQMQRLNHDVSNAFRQHPISRQRDSRDIPTQRCLGLPDAKFLVDAETSADEMLSVYVCSISDSESMDLVLLDVLLRHVLGNVAFDQQSEGKGKGKRAGKGKGKAMDFLPMNMTSEECAELVWQSATTCGFEFLDCTTIAIASKLPDGSSAMLAAHLDAMPQKHPDNLQEICMLRQDEDVAAWALVGESEVWVFEAQI